MHAFSDFYCTIDVTNKIKKFCEDKESCVVVSSKVYLNLKLHPCFKYSEYLRIAQTCKIDGKIYIQIHGQTCSISCSFRSTTRGVVIILTNSFKIIFQNKKIHVVCYFLKQPISRHGVWVMRLMFFLLEMLESPQSSHVTLCFSESSLKYRLIFSRFLYLRENLRNVKRKTCFSREKKHLPSHIYLAIFC